MGPVVYAGEKVLGVFFERGEGMDTDRDTVRARDFSCELGTLVDKFRIAHDSICDSVDGEGNRAMLNGGLGIMGDCLNELKKLSEKLYPGIFDEGQD